MARSWLALWCAVVAGLLVSGRSSCEPAAAAARHQQQQQQQQPQRSCQAAAAAAQAVAHAVARSSCASAPIADLLLSAQLRRPAAEGAAQALRAIGIETALDLQLLG
eukprot:SAG31_NODE_11415_length_1033_cov_1.008565_2_plen_106_part_01